MAPPDFPKALAILKNRFPKCFALYLYGSFAEGREREDSDVDIAVLDEKPVPSALIREVTIELMMALDIDIDLVDLRTIPLTLSAQILESGKYLANQEPKLTAAFETSLMSRYCAFNEERKEILRDIKKRGSVYAR